MHTVVVDEQLQVLVGRPCPLSTAPLRLVPQSRRVAPLAPRYAAQPVAGERPMPEVDSLFQGDGGRCIRAAPLGASVRTPQELHQPHAVRRPAPRPPAEHNRGAILWSAPTARQGATHLAGSDCGPHAADHSGWPSRTGEQAPSPLRLHTAGRSHGRGRGCCSSLPRGLRRCRWRALSQVECCHGPR